MKVNINNWSKKQSNGFTLAETLIAVVVFGIFSILVTGIFLNVMKSTTRQEVLRDVKQNGDYALNVMISDIQSSKGVVNCLPTSSSLVITNFDGTTSTYSVDNRVPEGGINGIKRETGSTSEYLTSLNVLVGVGSLVFVCNDSLGFGDRVKIDFNLSHAKAAVGIPGRLEEFVNVPFSGLAIVRSK